MKKTNKSKRPITLAILNFIVNWMTNYALGAKMKGWVLGLSGGKDSGLVSTLCAMTGLPTYLLIMTIKHDANEPERESTKRAIRHAEWLMARFQNVTYKVIDGTEAYNAFKNMMTDAVGYDALSDVNSRSRFRMKQLYWLAGKLQYLVAGTGNRVEDYAVKFFTKFGDGGVDISPIADLSKTQVTMALELLGVNEEIAHAIPTDELHADSRTDEDQLEASYDELQDAMDYYDEYGEEMVDFTPREEEVFKIFLTRFKTGMHKMAPPPVCEIPAEMYATAA